MGEGGNGGGGELYIPLLAKHLTAFPPHGVSKAWWSLLHTIFPPSNLAHPALVIGPSKKPHIRLGKGQEEELAETLVGVEAFEELSGKAEALAGVLVVVAWA
eukprot:CAMPEP_0181211486 /NCGR_PEP_ID=MMETSP1096-20121128/23809_1 /TAXON_ID=156174 ORGANISM="Chrysochromulina ericina, Strain CCMP281" /NCGR_SAMPLE_ID=MMETSP1096 /ASSEMBLY_ACC=CAM_ASM_000453 /LENGTH=101 /DNA_ID=CAMNT_0023302885 /DNA_START=780 /DNA_END=1082 /DNA_ORIENTATION=-